VQGCAALEQKLRQCMDQPVRVGHGFNTKHLLTPHSATRTRRRTLSTTTCRECTPRSSALTSATEQNIGRGACNLVHYLYTHGTARRTMRQRARRRCLISDHNIGTAFRWGWHCTVYICNLREEDKSTNHHLSIAPLRRREVGRSATTFSGYHSMEARASASEPSFTHCVKQCNHVRRANAAADHLTTSGLCTTGAFCYIPNSCFFTSRTRVPSRSSPLPTATQNRLSTNTISTNLALFVLHVEARFMVYPAGL
jgi:hypothetical protein